MKKDNYILYLLSFLNINILVLSFVLTIMLSKITYYIDGLSSESFSSINNYIPYGLILFLFFIFIINIALIIKIFINKKE